MPREWSLAPDAGLDELLSLRAHLAAEGHRATLAETPVPDGALGGLAETLTTVVGSGAATGLTTALVTWVRQRRSAVSVTVRNEHGREVRVDAKRVRTADAEDLRALTAEVTRALDGDDAAGG